MGKCGILKQMSRLQKKSVILRNINNINICIFVFLINIKVDKQQMTHHYTTHTYVCFGVW